MSTQYNLHIILTVSDTDNTTQCYINTALYTDMDNIFGTLDKYE